MVVGLWGRDHVNGAESFTPVRMARYLLSDITCSEFTIQRETDLQFLNLFCERLQRDT